MYSVQGNRKLSFACRASRVGAKCALFSLGLTGLSLSMVAEESKVSTTNWEKEPSPTIPRRLCRSHRSLTAPERTDTYRLVRIQKGSGGARGIRGRIKI